MRFIAKQLSAFYANLKIPNLLDFEQSDRMMAAGTENGTAKQKAARPNQTP